MLRCFKEQNRENWDEPHSVVKEFVKKQLVKDDNVIIEELITQGSK